MKVPMLLLGFLAICPAWGHPHEWVDWGVGVVLEETKPVRVQALQLELTWDEWVSSLILTDFPQLTDRPLGSADLGQLDTTYGLGASHRSVSLTVTFRGRRVPVKPLPLAPRSNGKTVTLVYSLPLGLKVETPSELRVELYDPTFYADMGIRAKAGAFFRGVRDPASYAGSFAFEQNLTHPYYGGLAYPEVVVFTLKP